MDEALYEQIELYLANEMDAQSRAAFEARLEADPELAEKFRLYRQIDLEMSAHTQNRAAQTALEESLAKLNEQYFTSKQNSPAQVVSMKRRWLLAVASLALLVIIAWPLLRPSPKANMLALYTEYNTIDSLAGSRSGTDSLWQNAVSLFNSRQYQAALPVLGAFLKTDPSNSAEVLKAIGLCFRQLGQYNEAIAVFDRLAATYPLYAASANWNKALVFLKQEKKKECLQTLRQIKEADRDNAIKDLLKKLED